MTLLSQRHKHLLVLGLVEHVGETALAAVLAIEVSSHEDSSAALLSRALTAQTVDLAIVVNLVVLKDGQLDLPVLVLDLLGGGVVLLLPLLSTSPQPENEVLRRGRRRTTPPPRRSSTSTGRSSWPSLSTTRLTTMARSTVCAVSALLRSAALESSWLLTSTVSTAASAVSPTCSTSLRTSRCLCHWESRVNSLDLPRIAKNYECSCVWTVVLLSEKK